MQVFHEEGKGAKYAPDAYIIPSHGVVVYSTPNGVTAVPLSETDIEKVMVEEDGGGRAVSGDQIELIKEGD